jgi:hypothetical protein
MEQEQKDRAARVARAAEHVDLSLNPGFQDAFSNAMIFPD